MKRLILHIGTHKTGTTALQEFFADNVSGFKEQGICFPPTRSSYKAVVPSRNGRFLYEYARMVFEPDYGNKKSFRATARNIKAFKRNVAANDTLLLTDEGLWFLGRKHEKAWDIIKELFDEAGIEVVDIVVYLRRQDQFLASLWNQFVKGRTKLRVTLNAYAHENVVVPRVMDYDAGLRCLENIFGREHVHVRVYERDKLVDSDVRKDFCSLIGVDSASFVFEDHVSNPSLTSTALEIKRQVNYVSNYREIDDNFLCKPAQMVSSLRATGGPSNPVPSDLRTELLETYREGNARVARDYLGYEDGVLFTSPSPNSDGSRKRPRFNPLMRDTVRFFAAALTEEHKRLLKAGERIEKAEKRMASLERRIEELEASRRGTPHLGSAAR